MRERVLQRLETENIRFRSGPADVLEYAVYLGMNLEAHFAHPQPTQVLSYFERAACLLTGRYPPAVDCR